MNIKNLNKKLDKALNETTLPFINLKVTSLIDGDGYSHKQNIDISLTSTDISSILFWLSQDENNKQLMEQFEKLHGIFDQV
jgi:hypothetical protein